MLVSNKKTKSGLTDTKSNDLLRVPLIAQSWDPGSEEVETQEGNGRAREGERESIEKCCFCLPNHLKEL